MIPLHELSKVAEFMESESGVVAKGWNKKKTRTHYLISKHRVLLWQGENLLRAVAQ